MGTNKTFKTLSIMETKKSATSYYIQTRDLRSGTPEYCYWDWDEIDRKDNLDDAKAEYKKQLATHDTLRLVQVTFTTIEQSYKTPRFISELEQSLDKVREHVYKRIFAFLGNAARRNCLCNIQLTNGDTITEVFFNCHNILKVHVCEPNIGDKLGKSYTCALHLLSIEDQLIILKAITENQ